MLESATKFPPVFTPDVVMTNEELAALTVRYLSVTIDKLLVVVVDPFAVNDVTPAAVIPDRSAPFPRK